MVHIFLFHNLASSVRCYFILLDSLFLRSQVDPGRGICVLTSQFGLLHCLMRSGISDFAAACRIPSVLGRHYSKSICPEPPLSDRFVIRIILVQVRSLPDRSILEGDFADFTELSLGDFALVWMAYFIRILLVWTPESLAKAYGATNSRTLTASSPTLQKLT